MADKQRQRRRVLAVVVVVVSLGLACWIWRACPDAKARHVQLGWITEQVTAALGSPNMTHSTLSSMMGGGHSPVDADGWYYYRSHWWDRKSNWPPLLEASIVFYHGRVCAIGVEHEPGAQPVYIKQSPEFARLEAELRQVEEREIEEAEQSMRGD